MCVRRQAAENKCIDRLFIHQRKGEQILQIVGIPQPGAVIFGKADVAADGKVAKTRQSRRSSRAVGNSAQARQEARLAIGRGKFKRAMFQHGKLFKEDVGGFTGEH